MTDILDKASRSELMSRIRSSNTTPERIVRSYLHKAGLRFTLRSSLPGRPDLVLPKWRAVVRVHGCFWHRHAGCRQAYWPKSNVKFWRAKFDGNVARDRRTLAALRRLGWRVFTVWECNLRRSRLDLLVRRIKSFRS